MNDEEIKKIAKGMEEQRQKGFNMQHFNFLMLIKLLQSKGIITPKEFFEFYINNYENLKNEISIGLDLLNEETIIKALKKEI